MLGFIHQPFVEVIERLGFYAFDILPQKPHMKLQFSRPKKRLIV